jgi:hypothetical protein
MVAAPRVNRIDPRTLAVAVAPIGRLALAYSGSYDGGRTWDAFLATSDDPLAPNATWWSSAVNDPSQPLQTGSPSSLYGDRDWFGTVQFDRAATPWAGFHCVRTPRCPSGRFGLVGHLSFPPGTPPRRTRPARRHRHHRRAHHRRAARRHRHRGHARRRR